ncbi:chromosomal replication initiator protein DnaA, partial [bacterium]|nr:chromosomal replication initiator protein DnaA [bacterium]
MNYDNIWTNFLNLISNKVTPVVYNAWFKDSSLAEIENGVAKIIVPYAAMKNSLMSTYYDLIVESLNKITTNCDEIKIYLKSEFDEEIKNKIINTQATAKMTNFEQKNVEFNDEIEEYVSFNNLKKEYTFENFVVGDSNRFAYMSALQVAERPAVVYNPLFIYGRSGLGKTHLMHAIGNYIVENSDKKVLYITTEDFKNDFINITKKDKTKEDSLSYIEFFKKKYRDIDVLMIDDIQFLENANKTQDEFANTFNSLFYNQKQIIICSDRSANDIKNLEDRLKTRFNWGLTVPIDPPEFALKISIIKKKIKSDDLCLDINDDIIELIATFCGNDVRNIEGSIRRIQAYCAMMNIKDINDIVVKDALQDYTTNVDYSSNNIYKIQSEVATYFKITVDDLKSKKRSIKIIYPRQIAMYLCRIM